MNWTTLVSVLAVLSVAVIAVGALVRLVVGPLSGPMRTAAGVTVALVLLLVVGAAAAGARGTEDRWLANGGYW